MLGTVLTQQERGLVPENLQSNREEKETKSGKVICPVSLSRSVAELRMARELKMIIYHSIIITLQESRSGVSPENAVTKGRKGGFI